MLIASIAMRRARATVQLTARPPRSSGRSAPLLYSHALFPLELSERSGRIARIIFLEQVPAIPFGPAGGACGCGYGCSLQDKPPNVPGQALQVAALSCNRAFPIIHYRPMPRQDAL